VTPRIKPVIPYGVAPNICFTEALSPRELEILEWVAQGYANPEIAARLGLAERTVRTHCSNILGKLGVSNRTHAVYLGYKLGYLTPPCEPNKPDESNKPDKPAEPHTAREAVALAAYYAALANVLLQREDTP
jgi:DNA-binding CsgD family transcriptional regulator